MSATTRHPEYEHALPGYGAYKLSDTKDARRRRPDVSLEGYARSRGLEFLDTKTPNGYQGVVPADSRLQFNVLRGDLSGGRPGILFHHVLAVPYDPDSASGLTVSVYKPKLGFRDALSFVPVLGHVFDAAIPPRDKRPQAVGAPTTEAAALVPEAATVPALKCTSGSGRLKALSGVEIDPAFAERLRATAFGDVVRTWGGRPYFRIGVAQGQLSIRVDGYLTAEDELDALARAVSMAAEGLAKASAPLHAPAEFAEPLPGPDWPREPGDVFNRDVPIPPSSWLGWLRAYAAEHGATPEDAFAYHRAFPRLPVPGTAFAVLRFTLPGTSTPARLAWHNERSILTHNVGCNALLLPAAEGAGVVERTRVEDLGVQYAVRDGIFCVWGLRRWRTQAEGMGDVDGLVAQGLELARRTGLARL